MTDKLALLVILITACDVCQAVTFLSSVTDANGLTDRSVRITFTTDTSFNNFRVKYGEDPSTIWSTRKAGSIVTKHGERQFGGLKPDTTYYYVACVTPTGASEQCDSNVRSFRTLPAGTLFLRPDEPRIAPMPAMPDRYVATYTVTGANHCRDKLTGDVGGLQAVLDAAGNNPTAGAILIKLPARIECIPATNQSFYLRTRRVAEGTVVLMADLIATGAQLPPENVTIGPDWPAWELLPRLQGENPNMAVLVSGTGTRNYRLIGIRFENVRYPAGMGFPVTYDATTRTFTLTGRTVVQAALATSDIIQAYDETGNQMRNAKIALAGLNSFSITRFDENNSTLAYQGKRRYPGRGKRGWRRYRRVKFDPSVRVIESPAVIRYLVNFDSSQQVRDIVFDRCVFTSSKVPSGVYVALRAHATNLHVINSAISDIDFWCGNDPDMYIDQPGKNRSSSCNSLMAQAIDVTWIKGVRMENNLITNVAGIAIFTQEGGDTYSDFLFRRNYMANDDRYGYGWPGYDGFYRPNIRHWIEFKKALRYRLSGNVISKGWHMGITGAFDSEIALSPRCANSAIPDTQTTPGSSTSVEHVIIESNIVHDVGGFVTWNGSDNGGFNCDVPQPNRGLIANNLVYNIDGYARESVAGQASGALLYLFGVRDVSVVNNTIVRANGTNPMLWQMYYDRSANLRVAGNLMQLNTTNPVNWQSDSFMTPAVPKSTPVGLIGGHYSTPNNELAGAATANVIIPGVPPGRNGLDFSQSSVSAETCKGWGFAVCVPGATGAARLDAVGFIDWRNHNYTLQTTSPYYESGINGRPPGADFDALNVEQGTVQFARYSSDTNQLIYMAPDSSSCSFEVGPQKELGTGTYGKDVGGSRFRATTVKADGYVKLYCGVDQFLCSAKTGECTKLRRAAI